MANAKLKRVFQNSGRDIQQSVRGFSSKELVVPCSGCGRHAQFKLIRLLIDPDKSIVCKDCDHVVCSTSSRPLMQSHSLPPNWKPSGDPFRLDSTKRVIFNEPKSIGSQLTIAETSQAARRNSEASSTAKDEPEPEPPSRNPTPSGMKGGHNAPARRTSVSFSGKPPTLHDAPSKEYLAQSSSEYLWEDGSMDGNPRSRSGSLSLTGRPSSTFRVNDSLGFETMGDKSVGRHSWSSSRYSFTGTTHRPYSPSPSGPHVSGSALPSAAVSRRSTSASTRRLEDYHPWDPFGSPRLSTESSSSQDWQNTPTNRSSVDSELDQGRGLAAALDRTRRSLSPREPSRALYKFAVSRGLRRESEDESEARRHESVGTDSEFEPTDEQVRNATHVWNTQEGRDRSDVQWARDILQRHNSMKQQGGRYTNPLRAVGAAGGEDFSPRPREAQEAVTTNTAYYHPQQPHALTIPVSPVPFTEDNIPTPIKEEPDTAGFRNGSPANGSPQEPRLPLASETEPSEFSLAGPSQPRTTQTDPADAGQAKDTDASTTTTTPSEAPRPRSNPRHVARRWKRRCRKLLKAIALKFSSFRRLPIRPSQNLPTVAAATATAAGHRNVLDPESARTRADQDVDMSEAHNPRIFSGDLRHDPSEEEVTLVGNQIISTLHGMSAPLIQMEFEATPLQLGFDA